MSSYSVADAKNRLPALIDKALDGEEVIITRHGRPVVELRPATQPGPKPNRALYEWLRARREASPRVDVSSVELLRQMHEEDEPRR